MSRRKRQKATKTEKKETQHSDIDIVGGLLEL
jgi:hypothetical protein